MNDLDLVFRNARIVAPTGVFEGWLSVEGGRIRGMGADDPPKAARMIDANGLHLMAGRVDSHCHLRAGAFGDDVEATSREAVAGGVTTFMPHMRAKQSYLELVPDWIEQIEKRSVCDVAFHLQIQVPSHHAEIAECYRRFGIQSYKVHIDARRPVANMGIEPVDDGDVYMAMREVREFDGIVAIHCENSEITRYLDEEIRASGRRDLSAWADVRPPLAEAADVNSVVFLASQLRCRLLIVHVSAVESLAAVRLHGYRPVVVEALIHQLAIPADDAQARLGANGKMNPPLRGADQIEGLWAAVRSGEIMLVGTDHSANAAAKMAEEEGREVDFWEAEEPPAGIGVGTPLFLTDGLRRGMDLVQLSRLMSQAAAETFGMADRKGSLIVGKDADLMLVDLETERKVAVGTPQTPGKTIATGLTLRGWPVLTMVRGKVLFEDGSVADGAVNGEAIRRR